MNDVSLDAVILVCTLSPSPTASSAELLGRQVADDLKQHNVTSEIVRVVDHDVKPGVKTDMGGNDAWPSIRAKVLAADILVLATPIWLGHPSSVTQRVLERLNAESAETDDQGRPHLFDKAAMIAVVGNEDGAHHVIAEVAQGLSDVGFTIPAQGSTYWVGEAMHGTDYQDLKQTPEATAGTTSVATQNTAHLAALLKQHPYPAN